MPDTPNAIANNKGWDDVLIGFSLQERKKGAARPTNMRVATDRKMHGPLSANHGWVWCPATGSAESPVEGSISQTTRDVWLRRRPGGPGRPAA